jgi:TetR/AcrR family transcriptional regulator
VKTARAVAHRFLRARKPEEKAIRRQAILSAAHRLAREVGPIELGLNELGRRSGVSKPNIYRYFESREEILLCLLVAEMKDLADGLEPRLGQGKLAAAAFADALTAEFLSRPLLCQLAGMTASILEHNLSAEAIAAAKREMLIVGARFVGMVQRAFPWISFEDAAWANQAIALYVSALWPAANPSPAAAEALRLPELQPLRVEAGRDLPRFIATLFRGLQSA